MRYGWRYDARGGLVGRSFTDHTGATFDLKEDLDRQGRTSGIATQGALPAALGGRRVIAAAIGWQELVTGPFAQRIVHGDGSADQFEAPSLPAAPDAPRLQQASLGMRLDMPGAGSLRQSPGRDTDAAGLPAAIATVAADQHLEWNAAGQLARSTRAGGSTRYLYDASRQRVARIVTDAQGRTTATLFFHHDHQLVAEADAGGRMQYAYAYLGRRPLAQADLRQQGWWGTFQRWLFGAPLRHLHTDRAGRVMAMTQDGDTVWRDSEASTPRVLQVAAKSAAKVHQPLRYVSQYYDEDSGLAYHGMRYFDPGSGRFLSPDPAGITDALHDVPAPLLLDLYAYAGGRPDEFFDPDGAARIRYFAITTDAKGKALGMAQGFTQARWAFIVDNVNAGLPTSPLGQKQNEYARKGTALLVDVSGNFLQGGTAATWIGAGSQESAFRQHYGTNLISILEFTLEMSDADAATLIATYIPNDLHSLFPSGCPPRSALLPQIRFATGEANINVTNASANGANKQRVLNCNRNQQSTYPVQYANDEERRRVEKFEAAAELTESPAPPALNKDCSQTGCPGMDVKVNGHTYHASFGRTQFVGSTFLEALQSLLINNGEVSAADKNRIGLTQDIIKRINDGLDRSRAVGVRTGYFNAYRNRFGAGLTAIETMAAWNTLTADEKTNFQSKSGLGQQEFIDMLGFQPSGAITMGEGRNAFMTEAIFGDPVLRDWLMAKFRSFDDYNYISRMFLRANLRTVQSTPGLQEQFVNNLAPDTDGWASRQRSIEENLAARVARIHNGGIYRPAPGQSFRRLGLHPDLDVITRSCTGSPNPQQCDINGRYVGNFLGIVGGRGEWRSLRCTDDLNKQLGLEMKALSVK